MAVDLITSGADDRDDMVSYVMPAADLVEISGRYTITIPYLDPAKKIYRIH